MARKPNYDFEKRKKEMDRKAKKEAKAQRKLENAGREIDESTGQAVEDDATETDAAAVRPE